jgi:hypothetical protein
MKLNKFTPKKNVAQAMVEFAIVLPILLMLLYGLLEVGRLLFMYSSIVTSSRQAVRYGSATGLGIGTTTVERFRDCKGIRETANKTDYLNAFNHETDDVRIFWDEGPDDIAADREICLPGEASSTWTPSSDNDSRIIVRVRGHFYALVKLLPLPTREIKAESSRTILLSVPVVVPVPGGGAAPEPTSIDIDDNPAPSDAGELVSVKATVSSASGTPDGTVTFSFEGTAIPGCIDVSLTGGIYTCNIRFFMTGDITVAFTPSDSAVYDPSDATKEHVVETAAVSITVYDDPPLSLPGASVTVTAKVRNSYDADGTYVIPTGSVTFTNDEGVSCTDNVNTTTGYASCGLVFTVDGNYVAVFTSTDSYHDSGGSATGDHQVSIYTATATNTPEPTATATATPVPTATLVPTNTSTPTVIPTSVLGCNSIKDYLDKLPKKPSPLVIDPAGYTMTLLIPNPNSYPVEFNDILVAWNGGSGHRVKPGQTEELRLMSVALNGTLWQTASPGQGGSSYTIQDPFLVPAVIEPNSSATLTFTFDKTYNNPKDQELVTLQFATLGCEAFTITVTR